MPSNALQMVRTSLRASVVEFRDPGCFLRRYSSLLAQRNELLNLENRLQLRLLQNLNNATAYGFLVIYIVCCFRSRFLSTIRLDWLTSSVLSSDLLLKGFSSI